MINKKVPARQQAGQRHRHPHAPFRLSPMAAAVVAGVSLLASGSLYAADTPNIAELQAEIARLKQIIAVQGSAKEAAGGTPAASATCSNLHFK